MVSHRESMVSNPQGGYAANDSRSTSSASTLKGAATSSADTGKAVVPAIFSWLIWPLILTLPLAMTVRALPPEEALRYVSLYRPVWRNASS